MIAPLSLSQLEQDKHYMDQHNCDVRIANVHRGTEYRIAPTHEQRQLAHALIDIWFDLILGAHSHVPWLIEQYNNRYIFYSLGNHIFDQDRGYKTCDRYRYDTIYDYQLGRCTVPTYIGMNVGLDITKKESQTRIMLSHLNFFGIKKGIAYELDSITKQELIQEITKELPTKPPF